MAEAGVPLPNSWHRISYFHCSLFGYFLGLLTATVSSEVSIFTEKNPIDIIFSSFPVFTGLQSCPTGITIFGTFHIVTSMSDGISQRRSKNYVARAFFVK